MMIHKEAFICDAIRTPIGRYGGVLSGIRTDDLGAIPIRALIERNPEIELENIDDLYYGCANQAGEDNRNVARMCALLAQLPVAVPGVTVNRLCGSGMEAIGQAGRAIKSGEADLLIAGGVESMSRAPLVISKADTPFARNHSLYDSTIGWRFANPLMEQAYGIDSMPETAENVATTYNINRQDQDAFAFRSQQRAAAAIEKGIIKEEIVAVEIPGRKGTSTLVTDDEHCRPQTTLEKLSSLPTPFREDGTVTAGNASGVNDGACSVLVASEEGIDKNQLNPLARILSMASTGIEPRLMGMGPLSASQKALRLAGLTLDQIDVIELNEAFAAQALAVLRALGISDDSKRVNPNGGAIAYGHPLGMSGARLVTTATRELHRSGGRYALCTMCVGVGQGIAMVIERSE
jgi:3-oxoadipyl-CoA thiolase